jgi:DNA-binding transcriptional regulator LsrR (DeoR family)
VFIARDGSIAKHSINRKVIGLGLEELKKAKTVVGIAFGLHKIDCILASLRGKYINMLITDESTARRILDGQLASNS